MSLPGFNQDGDLPPGVHQATLAEVVVRFGQGAPERETVTARLLRVHGMARATGSVRQFVLFGSYVTTKSAPNDVDVVLVMEDSFAAATCDESIRALFDHQRAQRELGCSIFWIRPSHLLQGSVEEFVAHWQVKRDLTRRGIVEVID